MSTIRLFDQDAYLTEATATVLSCDKTNYKQRDCYACVLNQTIFFPEEGGQSPDQGTIDGIEVLDVQVRNGVITHYLDAATFSVNAQVSLKLDWNHRFHNMQQHSGEHIFSGTVHRLFGFDNVGFHLSDNSVTMDFNGVLSDEDLKRVEFEVNTAIARNLEISAEYVDEKTLQELEYRSKKELLGPVRIVTIPGYDICACCAPHVHRTGEIGMLKVIHRMNYKGGVRVHILCGFRALEYYRESLALIDELSDYLTSGRENLLSLVKQLKEENYSMTGELANLRMEMMKKELEQIPKERENVVLFYPKQDTNLTRAAVNLLTAEHSGVAAVFSGSDEAGYSYILGSKTKDVWELQKQLATTLMAKGGGKPEMISGKVASTREEILKVLNF